jgi:hypothetical protein
MVQSVCSAQPSSPCGVGAKWYIFCIMLKWFVLAAVLSPTVPNAGNGPPSVSFVNIETSHLQETPTWYKQPEWWLCIFGVPTLGFVAWQTWSTARAAKAALLNAEALINSERAWIMAELRSYGNYSEQFEIAEGTAEYPGEGSVKTTRVNLVKLACKNQGRSPAWIDAVYGQLSIVNSTTVAMDPSKAGNQGPMQPIGPGGKRSRSLELVCRGIRHSGEFLSIYVVIEYRDIFDRKRETFLGYSVHDDGSFGRQFGAPERNRNT